MKPSLPSPVLPGQMVADKYRVERVLGEGGMGVVVAARHVQLNILVAIKFLLPHVLKDEKAVMRFAREARAAVRIKSEHVARITDVGTLDNGAPYMVMEYLEGKDLSALLRARGRLTMSEALHFVLQACQAIAEAHQLGIVHRDLKPSNLFLTRGADRGQIVKVLDFGISKNLDPDVSHGTGSMTTAAGALGSPTYMSPEQLTDAREVDARTDIWALGVILFELLTGVPPFKADNLPKLFLAILHKKVPNPAMLRPDLPRPLVAAILRCLEKDRSRRFSTVQELAVALSEVAPPRARLSLERIARLSGGGAKDVRSSSHLRTDVRKPTRDGPMRPDLLSSPDGWNAASTLRDFPRRKLLVAGVPTAIGLALGTYFLLHRPVSPSQPPPSASASIASTVPDAGSQASAKSIDASAKQIAR